MIKPCINTLLVNNIGWSLGPIGISLLLYNAICPHNARIVLCGQIALYNSTEIPMGPRLQPMLLTRSVLLQGFIIGNYQSQFSEGSMQLATWVKEGKLKYKETIVKGFVKLPAALLGLFEGDNIGKMIVEA